MNKKKTYLTVTALTALLILLVAATYAYFTAQGENTTSDNVSITSNTTDHLSFQISNDISFRVSQSDLSEGGNNKSGESTATAIFTPNNYTGTGSMNYYLYLNITKNGINYSSTNTNNTPELMIQLYDNNNQLIHLSGLGEEKTIKGVTGYDITGRLGLVPILNPHTITSTNGNQTTEIWKVKITMINLDIDQNDNTNKEVEGQIIISKDKQIDSPRIVETIYQSNNETPVGAVETIIEPLFNNDNEEIYSIYTVGYITGDSITGTTYSIDIKNMDADLSKYDLVLDGAPQVMTTQNDYSNYVTMKSNGLPLTSLSNGNLTSAVASAQELYNYSLSDNELSINSVILNCNTTKCTATISETFNNIIGKNKHETITNNGDNISVLYNGIKFNLKMVKRPSIALKENVYHHDSNLTNGAGDGSYRYSGANPNNFVCFGSNATPCPSDNLYRIIGVIPVSVVINEETTPVTTETQMLYKLIKYEFETEETIGLTKNGSADKYLPGHVMIYNGNIPEGTVDGFFWTSPESYEYSSTYGHNISTNSSNVWSLSTLNSIGLNSNAYGLFNDYWKSKIANVVWKVGGNEFDPISRTTPMNNVYSNEIINPIPNVNSVDGKTELSSKIGLMYATDYGYAAPQSAWTTTLYNYNSSSIRSNNWLYKGVNEWTITRVSTNNPYGSRVFTIDKSGSLYQYCGDNNCGNTTLVGLRRSFYLTEDTEIDVTNYSGTVSDPYRVI